MATDSSERRRLSRVATAIAERHRAELETRKKSHEELSRDDFLWHYLLLSFATMGKSSGAKGLIKDPGNYSKVDYAALRRLPVGPRVSKVERILTTAGVRWPSRKAVFISACLDRIDAMGGLVAAKQKLLGLFGREKKIAFLDAFPGIGPKYARNIMMDVYHEDFRDSIAVDSRLKKISKTLNLKFDTYQEEEQFFLGAAHEASLEGWELDRLIYNHLEEFLELLSTQAVKRSAGG